MTNLEDHGVDVQETVNEVELTPEDRRGQWEEHMRRWRSSGISQAAYCRRNALKLSTFQYWKKRLREMAPAVTLVQVPISNGLNSQPSRELTLLLGGHYKVEIGDNFNPTTLARLVDILGRL